MATSKLLACNFFAVPLPDSKKILRPVSGWRIETKRHVVFLLVFVLYWTTQNKKRMTRDQSTSYNTHYYRIRFLFFSRTNFTLTVSPLFHPIKNRNMMNSPLEAFLKRHLDLTQHLVDDNARSHGNNNFGESNLSYESRGVFRSTSLQRRPCRWGGTTTSANNKKKAMMPSTSSSHSLVSPKRRASHEDSHLLRSNASMAVKTTSLNIISDMNRLQR